MYVSEQIRPHFLFGNWMEHIQIPISAKNMNQNNPILKLKVSFAAFYFEDLQIFVQIIYSSWFIKMQKGHYKE